MYTLLRKIFLLVSFIFLGLQLPAQEENTVLYKEVRIDGVPLGTSKGKIIQKFGKPQKITNYENESNDDQWKEFHYGRSLLQVEDNYLRSFKLGDSVFQFSYKKLKLRVGDPVSKLKASFPISFRTYKKERRQGQGCCIPFKV